MAPFSSTLHAQRSATPPQVSLEQQAALFAAQTGSATLDKTRAAKFLGVSVDHFHDHVDGRIPVVQSGRRRMYRVVDLLRWLDDNASAASAQIAPPVAA